jgi:hypothetical protein
MRRNAVFLGLTFGGLALFAAFAAWAFLASSRLDGGWRSLLPVWPYVIGGLLAVAALTGGLMWLAFYSANHGYDDRIDSGDP